MRECYVPLDKCIHMYYTGYLSRDVGILMVIKYIVIWDHCFGRIMIWIIVKLCIVSGHPCFYLFFT